MTLPRPRGPIAPSAAQRRADPPESAAARELAAPPAAPGPAERRDTLEQATAADRLQVAVRASRMGRWDWHLDTGHVLWDTEHARLFGLAPGTFDGTLDGVLACLHPSDRDRVTADLARAVREQTEYEGTFRVVHPDGQSRAILSRGRLLNRVSDPAVMSGVAVDVTDSLNAAERASRLHQATAALAAAATPAEVAQALDEAVGSSLPTAGVRSTVLAALDPARSHLDIVAGDRLQPALVRHWTPLPLHRNTPLAEAARTGRHVLALTPQELDRRFPEVSTELALLGATGVLAMPLSVAGQVRGALAVHFSGPVTLTAEDEQFLHTIASQCAQALDRALLTQHEHDIAETLQQHLLPDRLPDLPGLTTNARYLPGTHGLHVGGDWYDLVDLGNGAASLVIGDVVGKGLPAAMLMAQIRHGMRALLTVDAEPAAMLQACDRLADRLLDDSAIITVFYGLLDLATGQLAYASAGHPPPLLIPKTGSSRYLPVQPQPPLGAGQPGQDRQEQRSVLSPGQTLLLYTDGLIEQRDRDLDTGLNALRHAADLERHNVDLLPGLLGRMLGPTRPDDVAVLTVQPHDNNAAS